MPQLLSQLLSPTEWKEKVPNGTPGQRFFHKYVTMVDAAEFLNSPLGSNWYSPECIFHNQNNLTYTGVQIFSYLSATFGQFKNLKHDVLSCTDIEQDDGSSHLFIQFVRKVWSTGESAEGKKDIRVPVFWMCRLERVKEGEQGGTEGWWFKEVWIYWDTILLAPIMPKDPAVFRANNPET